MDGQQDDQVADQPDANKPDGEGDAQPQGQAAGAGEATAQAEALQAKIVKLQAELAGKQAQAGPWPAGTIANIALALNSFMSSGWFFMLVGAALLWAAYGTMGETHTSFTFVLVVVGIAILLYGTGTQSAGEAASDKVKVYLAGGAGVLAFLVGYGIVEKSADIKAAFQVEKKYFRYTLEGADDGASDLGNYAAIADINGDQVPAMLRGRYIELYVPYFDRLLDGKGPVTIRGRVRLYLVNPVESQVAFKQEPIEITIEPGREWTVADGSYEVPLFNGPPQRVSVRAPVKLDSATSDRAELPAGVPLPPPLKGALE
jgi:hypothetical protein